MTERRVSHRAALLALLSDGQVHHMRQCQAAGGWRYGGRIHELRKLGHDIETIFLGEDETAYQLHAPAPVEAKQMALI